MTTICKKLELFKLKFPEIVLGMMNCPQNPKYHGEGDVWKHTLMCCENINSIPDYCSLDDYDKDIIDWAIILRR